MSELTEDIAKRIVSELLSDNAQLRNLGNYGRCVAKKNKVYNFRSKIPSRELQDRYGIYPDGGFINYVWWLLEQVDKGNIIIKDDAQPEP